MGRLPSRGVRGRWFSFGRDAGILRYMVRSGSTPARRSLVPGGRGASTSSRRGEILTFPDTLTTQGLSLWSLNIVLAGLGTRPPTPPVRPDLRFVFVMVFVTLSLSRLVARCRRDLQSGCGVPAAGAGWLLVSMLHV